MWKMGQILPLFKNDCVGYDAWHKINAYSDDNNSTYGFPNPTDISTLLKLVVSSI